MDEIDPELLLLRQIKRRRIGLAIGLSVVASIAMYPCLRVLWEIGDEVSESDAREAEHDHEATPEQRAQVERALAAAEAALPARNAEFAAAMAAGSALVVRPDLGPCPIHVPLRAEGSAQDGYSVNNTQFFEALGFPGRPSFPWAQSPVVGDAPRVAYARERIASLRASITRHDTLEILASEVRAAEELTGAFWTYDVVIVATMWRMPSADVTGTSFEGGYVSGTAYLHDYASGSVLCAGSIEASTTSEVVDYRATGFDEGRTLNDMLRAEMVGQIERAISRGVVYRAGPPLPPGTSECSGAPL